MRFVYEGLRAADALLLATPVYYYTMSGWLKAVVDRTFALIDNDYQSRIPRGKLLFVVTTQEEADRQDGEAVVRTLERAFSWIGMKLAGSLVCTGLFAERDYQGHPELLLAARDLLVANEKTLDGRRRRR
jgi:multimeric flavodoxin WrbA